MGDGIQADFNGYGRVCARSTLPQFELFARLNERGLNLRRILARPPDFQARYAGHAVSESAYRAARDRDLAHVEEFDVGNLFAVHLFENLPCVRALHLEAICFAWLGIDDAPLVALDFDVIDARSGMKFDPIAGRRPTNNVDLVVLKPEQNCVADDVTVVINSGELLCNVATKVLECIYPKVR